MCTHTDAQMNYEVKTLEVQSHTFHQMSMEGEGGEGRGGEEKREEGKGWEGNGRRGWRKHCVPGAVTTRFVASPPH